MSVYYQDELVTLHHGAAEDVLPTLDRVDHFEPRSAGWSA